MLLSRNLRLGLGIALLSALPLGLLDGAVAAFFSPLSFDTEGERLWFATLCFLCLLGPFVALGVTQTGVALVLSALAKRLARSNSITRTAPWLGRLCAALFCPAVATVAALMFRGQRAQRIPGHDLLAVLLCIVGLLSISTFVPFVLRLLNWANDQGPRRRSRSLLLSLLCLSIACGLYLVDLRVLPRLYLWFHLSIMTLSLVFALLFAVFFGLGMGSLRRRWLNSEWPAVVLGILAVVAGSLGLLRLTRATALAAAAMEHTVLCARVLWVERLINKGRPTLSDLPEPGTAPSGEQGTGPKVPLADIFLITVDALRADRLHERTMPFATELKNRGVWFQRAYTQVPHTSFAVATLLTGKPVYALSALGKDAADHETLPLILRRARYKTAAFYPPSVFFIEHERLRRLEESAYGFEYVKVEYLKGDRRTNQVLDFLETEKPERVFAWIHYLEPHEPYDVHEGGPSEKASDQERYDGEVAFVDREIRRLVSYLQQHRKGAIVILGADHGEEFGEHGGRYHGTSLYEEQVRVPLVVTDLMEPSRIGKREVSSPVGLIDVAPTILRLLDIFPSARMRGRDLFAGERQTPVFAEIGRKKMVVLGNDKLICDLAVDTCAVYDLASDPAERKNLVDRDKERGTRLRQELSRFLGEASRFERESHTESLISQEILARARLGDLAMAGELAKALLSVHAEDVLSAELQKGYGEGVEVLTQLCLGSRLGTDSRPKDALMGPLSAPEIGFALASAHKRPDGNSAKWAQIGLLCLSSGLAPAALWDQVMALGKDPTASPRMRLSAALALSIPDAGPTQGPLLVALYGEVLNVAMALDDPDSLRPLLRALGRTRDPAALPPLLAQLENVRSRVDVVQALGALGQKGAVPSLKELLLSDPYVPVRAAAATALADLGGSEGVLNKALAGEREAPVRAAITAALAKGKMR